MRLIIKIIKAILITLGVLTGVYLAFYLWLSLKG